VTPIFSPYLKRKSFWRPFIFYIHNSMARIFSFIFSFFFLKKAPQTLWFRLLQHTSDTKTFSFLTYCTTPEGSSACHKPQTVQSSPLYSTCRSFGDDRAYTTSTVRYTYTHTYRFVSFIAPDYTAIYV
jgi:hypothetical protein